MTPTQTMNDLFGEILYTIDTGIQFGPPRHKNKQGSYHLMIPAWSWYAFS